LRERRHGLIAVLAKPFKQAPARRVTQSEEDFVEL
jgi:hypothetical protein